MAINEAKIRAAKPRESLYKISDTGGLYLAVTPKGAKLWRYKYRLDGRENIFSVGKYPATGILEARRKHAEAKERVMRGEHPLAMLRAEAAARELAEAMTFRVIAEEWYAKKIEAQAWTPYYAAQVRAGLDGDLLPALGLLPIGAITPMDVLDLLTRVVHRGAPTVAINLRQWASQIFLLAVRSGRCSSDPAAPLKGVVLRPPVQHAKALVRGDIGLLMNRISAYGGVLSTKCALQLMAYTFVRTVEMRKAEWSEFDLENMVWTIPAAKMKKRRVHLVPISAQVKRVLDELRLLTGAGQFLFPNIRRPRDMMGATTVNRALERMGYASSKVTGHDFRATASTMLYEKGYREEVVEMQLAHVEQKKTKRSYNHAKYLEERRHMMQWYADELDAIAAAYSADVVA
ncbi:tyrosine-type recombinase/integrase [Dyella sp. 2RAF44]|jgi:integrase|uniref:tyrosine-type recombinase/integrase n=1 Tax=Dyella sp. 2RAF44 TaxID=3233000 RepID=UPI003F92A512